MKKRSAHASTSSLFLIELIIAVGFLALTAVVCVQLYLYAHELSQTSADTTRAVTEATNMIESYLAGDGTLGSGLNLYLETIPSAEDVSNGFVSSAEVTLGYDEDWTLLYVSGSGFPDEDGISYFMCVALDADQDNDGLIILSVEVVRNDSDRESLYEIAMKQYIPNETESEAAS